MSVPTTIQSKLVPLLISFDNGVTYKMLKCKTATNVNGSTATTSEDTDCGTFKAQGSPDWNVDFTGVVNTTPDSPSEASVAQVMAAWLNGVRVAIQLQTGNGLGGNIYFQGPGYISDFGMQLQTGSLFSFTLTIQGDGVPDITV